MKRLQGVILERSPRTQDWFVQDSVTSVIVPVHHEFDGVCVPGLHVEFEVDTIAVGTSEFDVQDMDVARLIIDKKKPKYQYGVLITKPWSSEMYDHNERIASIMKGHLGSALIRAFLDSDQEPEDTCYEDDKLYILSKYICSYGWSNFTREDVFEEAQRELERVQNYWLNDVWPDCIADGFVPALGIGFVGY